MKKRLFLLVPPLFVLACQLTACSNTSLAGGGWTPLLDGSNLDQWSMVGDANWRLVDGSAQADKGIGFLVSKNSYADFQIRAEFWADADANSGIYFRCSDPKQVTDKNAYEANIFDKRPDPTYGTGAITNVARIANMPKAAGKWNTYEVTAKGPELTVVLNGVQTVQARDNRFASGPIALQRAAGVIKFRKLEIRPL